MTSTLPPVNHSGSKTTLPSLRSGRSERSRTTASKRQSLGRLAGIEKADVSGYRNSYKHNLSLSILQDGYVSSFIELFELFDKQNEQIKNADSESGDVEVQLLIDQHDKLDFLKTKLIAAEDSRRCGAPDKAYDAYLELAHYFEQFPSDQWLIDHFHERCMTESNQVDDDGRKQAEANFYIGVALEKRGDLSAAIDFLEKFFTLTTDQDWQNKEGEHLHDNAAIQLYKTYTCLAEEVYEESQPLSIEYLKKAYQMAKEGGNKTEAGMASHRLGNIYEAVGDPQVATMYHKGYLDRCKRDKDKVGMGKAYEALGRCQTSEGKIEEALESYKEFVNIAKDQGQKEVYSQACSALADLYNMLGDYGHAVEYFEKAAENMETDDQERLQLMNISLAIARSHNTLQSYSLAILHNTPRLTASLVEWKDYRDDGFIMASRPATRAESTISGSATPTKEGGDTCSTPSKEQ